MDPLSLSSSSHSSSLPQLQEDTPPRLLLDRIRALEQQVATLTARNEELHSAQQYISSHAHAVVSPLVLSPSSIPPSEVTTDTSRQSSKAESELLDELKLKDQKIEYLEQCLEQNKKKLTQTEGLLYELQWDPVQDQAVCQLMGGEQAVQTILEKKMAQLLEQMRIMEKGLREKQTMIDKLSAKVNINTNINTNINNINAMTNPLNSSLLVESAFSQSTTADELISALNGITLIPIGSSITMQ